MSDKKQTKDFSGKDIIRYIKKYIEDYQEQYSIEESWRDCYKIFHEKRKVKKERELSEEEYNDLCIHLGFYLASWGMFRNSFLANKYYTIHKDVIGVLFKDEYDVLWDISAKDLGKHADILKYLSDEIKKSYLKYIENDKPQSVRELVKFYNDHEEKFGMARKEIGEKYSYYPDMKLLDMCFWKVGQKIMKEKKNE